MYARHAFQLFDLSPLIHGAPSGFRRPWVPIASSLPDRLGSSMQAQEAIVLFKHYFDGDNLGQTTDSQNPLGPCLAAS